MLISHARGKTLSSINSQLIICSSHFPTCQHPSSKPQTTSKVDDMMKCLWQTPLLCAGERKRGQEMNGKLHSFPQMADLADCLTHFCFVFADRMRLNASCIVVYFFLSIYTSSIDVRYEV